MRPTATREALGLADQPPRIMPGLGGTTAQAAAARAGGAAAGPGQTANRLGAAPRASGAPTVTGLRLTAAQPRMVRGQQPLGADIFSQATATNLPATRRSGGALAAGDNADRSLLIRGASAPQAGGPIVPRRLYPPSLLMQGVVALAMVIALMSVLTLSSPLGYGAAFTGSFQAYANAVAWIPTPTPTPTATPIPAAGSVALPASPGQQVVIDEIKQIFGSYAQGALNISHCESGWDPSARNPYPVGNSHAEGVFQILYPSTWDTTSYASRNPYDYDANIRAAYEIFSRDGNSWREWACKP
jgi:hypothetical protein